MGLAKWTALAAAGQSVSTQYEQQRQERLNELDHARKLRLESLRNENVAERQRTQIGAEQEIVETKIAAGQEQTGMQQAFREGESEKARAFKAEESKKQREHEEKLAGIRAEASKTKKQSDRWVTKTVKESGIVDGELIETENVTITDKRSGETFVQEGSKFIPQGMDLSGKATIKKGKEAEAQRWLIQNPEAADVFLETYGYLPVSFIRKQGIAKQD